MRVALNQVEAVVEAVVLMGHPILGDKHCKTSYVVRFLAVIQAYF